MLDRPEEPVAVPRLGVLPQVLVDHRPEVGDQDRLEELHLRPRLSERQRVVHAGIADLLQVGDPVVDRGPADRGIHPRPLEHLGVRPDDVGPLDVDGNRVDLAVRAKQIEEGVAVGGLEPVRGIEVGEVLQLAARDVVGEPGAGGGLERVGRIRSLEARIQRGTGVRSATAAHGGVDDLDAGVLRVEGIDEGVVAALLAARSSTR